jgi:hypothetical protein
LPRFDPAGTALGGRHSNVMVSPEDCGAGGLTNCLPLPLSIDAVSSYPSISMIEAAGATGRLRGRGAPVRAGAAAHGSSGCLRSFPEVRKTASHVSRTYLEVPCRLFLLQPWSWLVLIL